MRPVLGLLQTRTRTGNCNLEPNCGRVGIISIIWVISSVPEMFFSTDLCQRLHLRVPLLHHFSFPSAWSGSADCLINNEQWQTACSWRSLALPRSLQPRVATFKPPPSFSVKINNASVRRGISDGSANLDCWTMIKQCFTGLKLDHREGHNQQYHRAML